MSSFITSLLTELGFRTRLPRTLQPRPEAEASPNGQTYPTSNHNGDSTSREISKDSRVIERSSGDAGNLPAPPFFATLPKEMDGRIPEPEGSRLAPHHGRITDNQPIPVTNTHPTGPITHNVSGVLSATREGQRPEQDGTSGQRAPPLGTGQDGSGQSQIGALDIDELGQTSLPADDGMGWLRKKIHTIRDLDLNNNEKARMVHELMTESYNSTRSLPPVSPSMLSPMLSSPGISHSVGSPASEVRQISDPTPTSLKSPASIPHYETQFSLTPDDLQPTYVPKVEPESVAEAVDAVDAADAADDDPDTEECDEAILGCQHYHRNVKLQCHTCKKWYTCRFCHDAVEDHPLIRRDTENMLCMLCGHPQPAAQNCRQCDEQTAQYYCDICKLWDNDSNKSIYHCHDCGICRIGQGLGKDFFHCKTCSVCLPISIEDTHRCIERSTQCDCPICGDYMFTSPETVVVMRCGHSLHHKCLSEYSKTSFRCPICSKTITNMESTFRNLDRTIESQPMPVEFKDTKGLIYCNDCGAKSVVKYHWLGLKCDLCESYNTAQLRVLQGGDINEVLEEEGVGEIASRPRSASLNPDGEPATSLAALHLTTNPASSRLSVPVSSGTGDDRRSVSYNMTHGRAISPVVSNYFGLPTERESEKPSSLPFFGGASRTEGETEYGALNFLSKKLRDRYGFLAGDVTTAEATASTADEEEDDDDDDDEEDYDGESSDSSDTDEEDNEEDDDDDKGEYIDLFGHR